MVWALAGLAAVSAAERQTVRALTLWSAADLLRALVNSLNVSMSHDAHVSLINSARSALTPQTLAAAIAAGQAMSLDQIVAFALAD